jgi:hypothetical protein
MPPFILVRKNIFRGCSEDLRTKVERLLSHYQKLIYGKGQPGIFNLVQTLHRKNYSCQKNLACLPHP